MFVLCLCCVPVPHLTLSLSNSFSHSYSRLNQDVVTHNSCSLSSAIFPTFHSVLTVCLGFSFLFPCGRRGAPGNRSCQVFEDGQHEGP